MCREPFLLQPPQATTEDLLPFQWQGRGASRILVWQEQHQDRGEIILFLYTVGTFLSHILNNCPQYPPAWESTAPSTNHVHVTCRFTELHKPHEREVQLLPLLLTNAGSGRQVDSTGIHTRSLPGWGRHKSTG